LAAIKTVFCVDFYGFTIISNNNYIFHIDYLLQGAEKQTGKADYFTDPLQV